MVLVGRGLCPEACGQTGRSNLENQKERRVLEKNQASRVGRGALSAQEDWLRHRGKR